MVLHYIVQTGRANRADFVISTMAVDADILEDFLTMLKGLLLFLF